MLVCRFCMSENNVEIDLFQAALVSKFVCLPVKIKNDDVLPKKICFKCEKKLYDFYGFWECIQNVEQLLIQEISAKNIANDYFENNLIDNEGEGDGDGDGDDDKDNETPDISKTSQSFFEPEVVMSTPNAMYVNSKSSASIKSNSSTSTQMQPAQPVLAVPSSDAATAASTSTTTAAVAPSIINQTQSKTSPDSSCNTEDDEEDEFETNALNHYWRQSKDYANNNNYDAIEKAIKIEEFEDDENLLVHFMVDSQDIQAGTVGESIDQNQYNTSNSNSGCGNSSSNSLIKKIGKKPKSHECNLCGKILRSPGLLKSHIDEDHNFLRVECEFCDKRIKKKNFRKHLRTHDRSPKMPHSCPMCGKLFYILKSFYAHMNSCSSSSSSAAGLDQIDSDPNQMETTVDESAGSGGGDGNLEPKVEQQAIKIEESTNSETEKQMNFYCEICQKELESEEQLEKHKSVHDKCTCTVCGKVLATKAILKRHMDVHTNDIVCVQCNVCGKAFTRDSNLKAHMKIHLNLRTHICDECGKPFRRKYHLTRHMLTHSGEKPFPCLWCDKKYTSKESLRCHQKTSHFNIVF